MLNDREARLVVWLDSLKIDQGEVVQVDGLRTALTTCLIASITNCGSWA
jgi:hypothetical protein